jgi:hypothetical protein
MLLKRKKERRRQSLLERFILLLNAMNELLADDMSAGM